MSTVTMRRWTKMLLDALDPKRAERGIIKFESSHRIRIDIERSLIQYEAEVIAAEAESAREDARCMLRRKLEAQRLRRLRPR